MAEARAFAAACKQFCGMKPGETLQQFAAELSALTNDDRRELAGLLSVELGEPVTDGIKVPAA